MKNNKKPSGQDERLRPFDPLHESGRFLVGHDHHPRYPATLVNELLRAFTRFIDGRVALEYPW